MSKTRTRKPVLQPVRPYARLRREIPGEWGPFEEVQIRLPHGYALFSQYGTPWLTREGERLPVSEWLVRLDDEKREDLYHSLAEWMHTDAALCLWYARDPRWTAAERALELLRCDLDEGTACLQWAEEEADRGQIDVIERAVA